LARTPAVIVLPLFPPSPTSITPSFGTFVLVLKVKGIFFGLTVI
jgi:hypothetical protein